MLALRGAPTAGAASARDFNTQKGQPGSNAPLPSLQPRKDLRCYDVLGVSRFAKHPEIRHAYRQRALNLHPDKQQGQMVGFLALAEAFEVLSDASQRSMYDRELGAQKSRDGMAGADAAPMVLSPPLQRDCELLCAALMEIPDEEWPRHVLDVPTATIKEMHENLAGGVEGTAGVKRPRPAPEGGGGERLDQVVVASKPRHLCVGNSHRQRGHYCAQIQMCGIHIRTSSTRRLVPAAEAHLALVALKETFFFKWKENGMTDFDDTLRAAVAEARAQKMYFPGAMYWFEKMVEPEPNVKWRLTTPCTRDLESTLRNRAEVLQLLSGGGNKPVLQKAIDRMREAARAAKAAWEESRPSLEHRLYGFLSCELEHRAQDGAYPSKRRRLQGKQSTTQLCVQLPWFGRFAAQYGVSASDLEALLPPLQTRLRGVPSLEQCLQRALRNSLVASGQAQTALEDASRKAITSGANIAAALQRKVSAELAASMGKMCKSGPAVPPRALQPPPQPPQQQLQQLQQLQPPERQLPQAQQQPQPLQQHHQPQPLPQQQPQKPPQQRRPAQPPPQKRAPEVAPQQPQTQLHHASQKLSGQKRVTELQAESIGGGAGGADLPDPVAPPRSSGPRVVTRRSLSPGRTVVRDLSPVPRQMQGRARARKGWRECYSFILQELLADPEVERLFGQPVDLEMYPDYLQRISPNNPMDLRLIVDRLASEESGYADVEECSADVSMVWENAARFNAPGSYVRAIAEQAAKIINELLLGRRSMGRIWCRGSSPGQRSSLRPETRSRSETRARSQLSVQFGNESAVPKPPTLSDPYLDV